MRAQQRQTLGILMVGIILFLYLLARFRHVIDWKAR